MRSMCLTLNEIENTRLRCRARGLLEAEAVGGDLEGLSRGRRRNHVQIALAGARVDVELVGVDAGGLADCDNEVDVGRSRRAATEADDIGKAGRDGRIALLDLQHGRRT